MKNLLEIQVGQVWVEGEVSNLKKQGSGHWYFSLKDSGAQIACAMFQAKKREGSDALADGANVKVYAETSVYEARGQLQIIVQKVERAGMGDLQAKFEALKQKLNAEGLFDSDRKQKLPIFPQTIGLVTSGTGAALQDMLQILNRRAPWVQPVLYPVRVQGKGAEIEIARAINALSNANAHGYPFCDLIIVGRGGGSIEDLWCFNEEIVARAIASCTIPIISAVGHEIDFTIADFVADLRAPTPSAAIELAVKDQQQLLSLLFQHKKRMVRVLADSLSRWRLRLDLVQRGILRRNEERILRESVMRHDSIRSQFLQASEKALSAIMLRLKDVKSRHQAQHPLMVIDRRIEALTGAGQRLQKSHNSQLKVHQEQLIRLKNLLRTLGPEPAFQRGFSITLDQQGKLIRSSADLKPGDLIQSKFAQGTIQSRVSTPD